MTKIAGSGSRSLRQRHGSADPDPHQKCHGSATLIKRKVIINNYVWDYRIFFRVGLLQSAPSLANLGDRH
jgi:hypothetical protein